MNGLELCKKIHETDQYGKPKVIVVTALQDDAVEKQVKIYGVEHFFKKPIQLADLCKAVEKTF